jgi:intracellular septation protein
MSLLLEYSPLIAFIVGYKVGGIYLATKVLMIAMTLMLAITWLWKRKVTTMNLISTGLVLVLGSATLILRSAKFIQWKPTVFLWGVGIAFLVSAFIGTRPLAQLLLQSAMGDVRVERRGWLKVNAAFVLFCLVAGAVNLLVAYRASEATWVNVKVYGLTGAMFLFFMSQVWWLYSMNRGDPGK